MDKHDHRLKEFLHGPEHPALLLDTSGGLSLGPLPGLEVFSKVIPQILPCVDGLICSSGQLHRLADITNSQTAVLVRMDWTNTLRDTNFPLPPITPIHLSILDAEDTLALGASGMVVDLLLGYEESIEAHCLKMIVQLALAAKDLRLPLIVEVRPSGPRISLLDKAIELGVSFAQECGADAVVVPFPGLDSLKTIAAMLSVPWLLKPSSISTMTAEWETAHHLGALGLWLDHTWLAADGPLSDLLKSLRTLLQI